MESGQVLYGDLSENDTINSDNAIYYIVDQPEHGSVIVNDDGTFTYIPDAGYNGKDYFVYGVRNRSGDSTTAAVTITIDPEENCELLIPEIFSPNDDGIQDYFRIVCIDKYPDARIEIYNR